MNPVDPFEERLRRTPFREAPASLRAEVLRSVRTSTTPARPGANALPVWLASWRRSYRIAWGALGFAWLIVLLINLSAVQMGGSTPSQHVEQWASPALTAALHQQRAWRNRLLQEPAPAALPSTPDPDAGLWWDRRIGRTVV